MGCCLARRERSLEFEEISHESRNDRTRRRSDFSRELQMFATKVALTKTKSILCGKNNYGQWLPPR